MPSEPPVGGPTTVLVAGDSRVLSEALAAAIEDDPGLHCAAVVTDPATTLLDLGRIRPDVLLVDLHDDDARWPSTVLAALASSPAVSVVVLVADGSARFVDRLREEGARIVPAGSDGLDSLLDALRSSADTADHPDQGQRPGAHAQPPVALDPTDLRLLRLVAAGFDSEAAARELGIGAGLVRRRLQRICVELGAASPVQAVAVALGQGSLRLGPEG